MACAFIIGHPDRVCKARLSTVPDRRIRGVVRRSGWSVEQEIARDPSPNEGIRKAKTGLNPVVPISRPIRISPELCCVGRHLLGSPRKPAQDASSWQVFGNLLPTSRQRSVHAHFLKPSFVITGSQDGCCRGPGTHWRQSLDPISSLGPPQAMRFGRALQSGSNRERQQFPDGAIDDFNVVNVEVTPEEFGRRGIARKQLAKPRIRRGEHLPVDGYMPLHLIHNASFARHQTSRGACCSLYRRGIPDRRFCGCPKWKPPLVDQDDQADCPGDQMPFSLPPVRNPGCC